MLEFRQSSRHIGEPGVGESCPTCGMMLDLPGLIHEGRAYCCQGCVPTPEGHEGALHVPREGHELSASRAVAIEASPEEVRKFLADVELLHLYEQKLVRLQVTAIGQNGRTACATADGQFGVLPYHIELHFDGKESGYNSTLCSGGPILGLRGTFTAIPDGDHTIVLHRESYELKGGAIGRGIGRLLQPYIGWSLERELRTLKRLVEDPAALGAALRERDPRRIPVDPKVLVWDPEKPSSKSRGLFERAPSTNTLIASTAFVAGAAAGVFVARATRRR